ncbi:hypothetical protein [Microcystis phage Mwe-JY26]
MARDSQRSKVYKWEKTIFASQWKEPSLTKEATIGLIHKVLLDAGRNPAYVEIKFTKRRGGACANARYINFTPSRMPVILVLHELAHTLTDRPLDHRMAVSPGAWHDSRYVSCYLALIERYMNLDLTEALVSLKKGFEVIEKKYVPTGRVEMRPIYRTRPDGGQEHVRTVLHELHKLVEHRKKVSPPKYDVEALKLWRDRLNGDKT